MTEWEQSPEYAALRREAIERGHVVMDGPWSLARARDIMRENRRRYGNRQDFVTLQLEGAALAEALAEDCPAWPRLAAEDVAELLHFLGNYLSGAAAQGAPPMFLANLPGFAGEHLLEESSQ